MYISGMRLRAIRAVRTYENAQCTHMKTRPHESARVRARNRSAHARKSHLKAPSLPARTLAPPRLAPPTPPVAPGLPTRTYFRIDVHRSGGGGADFPVAPSYPSKRWVGYYALRPNCYTPLFRVES